MQETAPMSEKQEIREAGETKDNKRYRDAEYFADLYLRLSREDGDKAESDSISNQRELLTAFLTKHPEIQLHEILVDDGYSGVDFRRPGFEKMMKSVKNGTVNCIIVKDFSRLGRNFIETGKYIEKVFPFMGIRFIAVNDNYDSSRPKTVSDNLLVPVKNLMNDAYCRDISIKIRSQLAIKRKMGQCIAPFAVYGYQKSLNDRHKLEIDPLAAGVVQDIFEWKLEGYSAGAISRRLNEMGILCPMEYKRFLGSSFSSPFKQSKKAEWSPGTVLRILKDPVYVGTLTQGKRSRPNYKVKKAVELPKDKWVVMEHCHEPVVSQEIFDNVARLLAADTRTAPGKETVFILSGLLYCGDCKRSMIRKNNSRKDKAYYYYICSGYKQGTGCKSHSIRSQYAEEAAAWTTMAFVRVFLDLEAAKEVAQYIACEGRQVQKVRERLQAKKEELEKYKGYCQRLYEDYAENVISKEDMEALEKRYEGKIEQAQREELELRKELETVKETGKKERQGAWNWLEEIKSQQRLEKIERKLTVRFLNRIEVFENHRISIGFRFQKGKAWQDLAG